MTTPSAIERRRAALPRLVLLGTLSAAFFSTTWLLNRIVSLAGGHWAWNASLRYFYVALILAAWLALRRGPHGLGAVLRRFRDRPFFWILTGSIGCGIFYSGVCFAGDHAPPWVLATTWQLTILATPLVLRGFGLRVPLHGVLFAILIFAGILLVNLNRLRDGLQLGQVLLGVVPILIAAFAYPIANQLVNRVRHDPARPPPAGPASRLDEAAAYLLLMVLGSLPFWILLLVGLAPPWPAPSQLFATFLIALCSGVLGTTLFLLARNATSDPYRIAAVDATQAGEVVFTLAGEVLLLGGALPDAVGLVGLAVVVAGLAGFMLRSRPEEAAEPVAGAP